MNKSINIILIIAGILVAAGLVVIGIALLATRGNVSNLSTEKMQWTKVEKNLSVDDTNTLRVDVDTDDISIGISPDEEIHFTYYESEKIKYDLTQSAGIITLKNKRSGNWTDYIGLSFEIEPHDITILFPSDYSGSFDIASSTGDINIYGQNNLDNLSAEHSTGATTISECNVKSLNLISSTGRIYVDKTAVEGNVEAETSTGKIIFSELSVGGDMTLNTQTGGVDCENVTVSNAEITSKTGGVSLDNLIAEKIRTETSTGSISVKEIDAQSISLEATTGSVRGTVVGNSDNYSIKSSTNTGGNNLPDDWGNGERKLEVKTSTGTIDIDFEE